MVNKIIQLYSSYFFVKEILDFVPNRFLHSRITIPHIPVKRIHFYVPLHALVLLFCRKLQQKSFGSLENLQRLTVKPVLELIFPSLNENSHYIIPISWSKERRVVINLKYHSFSSHRVLNLYFSLMLQKRRRIFDIFTVNQKFLCIAKKKIAGLLMLWNNYNRIFLSFHNGIYPHFFLFNPSSLLSTLILQNFQQSFKRFIRASQTSGFWASWSLKPINEVNDL